MELRTIEWVAEDGRRLVPGYVRLIDQTRLPEELTYVETADVQAIGHAIRTLQVRGAPAIGVAAAMGVVAAVQRLATDERERFQAAVREAADFLAASRPTAINLFWALERMKRKAESLRSLPVAEAKEALAEEAVAICEEDAVRCRAIGEHGATLLGAGQTVMTHCNAGGLATTRLGTALAPLYVANEQGKKVRVIVDETRPLLQGSRLTAWELMQAGIDVTLICDSMVASVMAEGRVNAVMVGADRIVANGDTANKIGTYGIALAARAHEIPFYVLAPTSSFDLSLASGKEIPIEQRDPSEVTEGFGTRTAPRNVAVYAPAFDVTPARLIAAIVCENGIAYPPYEESLARLAAGPARTAHEPA